MGTLTVRDPYGREFQIDATARPFWEHREGHTILPPAAPAEQTTPAGPAPAPSGTPKPTTKAASRPASEDKE